MTTKDIYSVYEKVFECQIRLESGMVFENFNHLKLLVNLWIS